METGLVFDKYGGTIYWHVPADRSQGFLPDSGFLWQVLWENRGRLGGFAHTHPWDGPANPSGTDLTTFEAVEAGLGLRLVWSIVTFTDVVYLCRRGAGRHFPAVSDFSLSGHQIQQLRDLSHWGK